MFTDSDKLCFMNLDIKPIGIIKSPYKIPKEMPIQGRFRDNEVAYCELYSEYKKGLKDLDGFSHAILIYFFHKTEKTELLSSPFLEDEEHGIFSIRSPQRPNKIGLSVVKINEIENNKLFFTEVDMITNTPLLDIKPFVKYFDNRENTKQGWIDKHFENGIIPGRTIIKK